MAIGGAGQEAAAPAEPTAVAAAAAAAQQSVEPADVEEAAAQEEELDLVAACLQAPKARPDWRQARQPAARRL